MTRILIRGTKSPFEAVSAERMLRDNLIANNSGNLLFLETAWKILSTKGTEITVISVCSASKAGVHACRPFLLQAPAPQLPACPERALGARESKGSQFAPRIPAPAPRIPDPARRIPGRFTRSL